MTLNTNFNQSPYFDDFNEDDNFYRILFRPGYSVQARELTQLQSILQNQVNKFGNHVFKNGSQVIPGSVNVDSEVHFLKLNNLYDDTLVSSYISTFQHKIITGVTSGVKMRVLDHSNCDCVTTQLEIQTLYCKIEEVASDGETKRLIPGETIVAYAADNTTENNLNLTEDQVGDIYANIRSLGDEGETATSYSSDPSSDVIGYGYGFEVKEGIYYIDGFFVKNPELHLYVGRFDNTPTARIGFKVSETLVTPEQDSDLLDNATGASNYAAPGAHRYKISVSLVQKDLRSTDTDRFIELARVVDGVLQGKVEKSSYAELEKTFARRTYDESGNYEVNKFRLSLREHSANSTNNGVYSGDDADPDKFVLMVDSGKAYIQGYEVENTAPKYISIDKARENAITTEENDQIVRVEDKPISTTIGNYVIVNNTSSYPNISTFETLYLVDVQNSSKGAAPSSSNIVGTAKVRSYQLHSGDYADGDDTEFKLSLFDIRMNNGKSFAKDVKQITSQEALNAFTCDIVPTLYDITGTATSTTSDPTISGVGTEFIADNVVAGDLLYITGTSGSTFVGQVDSITNDLSLELTGNAEATISTAGKLKVGRAQIYLPQYDSLLFSVGYDYIKALKGYNSIAGSDDVDSTTLTVRRKFAAQTAVGTDITFGAVADNEVFISISELSNYLLINETDNTFVNVTTSDLELLNDDREVKFTNVITNGKSYSLIASVTQTSTQGAERQKAIASQTDTITGKQPVTSPVVTLTQSDGWKLVSVMMTNDGDYTSYTATGAIDITDRYEFDNGQTSTYYGKAKLRLKSGAQVPSGAIRVEYRYFEHSGTGNYFSVDSYTELTLDEIPVYSYRNPSNGKKVEISLGSVMDFRPVLESGSDFLPEIPKIGSDANADLAYYLGRIDKIYLDSVGNFVVLKGIPSLNPKEPEDPTEGMVICILTIQPYTKSLTDVKINQRENRRYTMKDIGRIERRVRNLEYYVSLSLLEKDTADLQIKDGVTGIDRFKNGFIVDSFTGHGIGDVKNPDYKVSVDPVGKQLRPAHFTTSLDIVENIASGTARASQGYQKTGDLITLPYTEVDFVYNPNATRYIDVNPYKIGAFKGEIELVPAGDTWKDTDRRPDLIVTDDNNFDAIQYLADAAGVTGTFWDEWETNWTGQTVDVTTSQTGDPNRRRQIVTGYETTVVTDIGTESREGIEVGIQSTVNSQDYGDRVVDISYASSVRSRPVLFLGRNLKNNVKFYPFFDGIDVKSYVKPADVFKLTTSADFMSFDANEVESGIRTDDYSRAYNGEIQQAFMVGDVLKNDDHTPVAIGAIAVNGGNLVDVTVSDTDGILVGHHVTLSNLYYHRARSRGLRGYGWGNIPSSSDIIGSNTARQLNLMTFKVSAIDGTTLTLQTLDGEDVPAFTSYNTSSYNTGFSGMLTRLTASCVAVWGGYVYTSDDDGNPTVQDVHVVNVQNGFGVGETLTGSSSLATSGETNVVTLTAINGSTSTTTPATMKALGDIPRGDAEGTVVGVFDIPNTDSVYFPVGEKKFKLTDSITNSDDDFDSKGTASYFAMGMTISKEKTIVNSREASFVEDRLFESIPTRRVTTTTRQTYRYYTGHDPLAQTFNVDSAGGAFVTSVDVYFAEPGVRPITVELRSTTTNGVPSTKILPFSTVTKLPSQVNVSDDASVATTFKFPAPIYLQEGETYALVVKADEPGLQVWVSELGKTDISNNNIVTQQPLTGSLYLSQNTKEFEINPLLDMKFTLKKAKFDISSSVNVPLRANPPLNMNLPTNPFEITPGTNLIRVSAPNHGLSAGDTVRIEGVGAGLYGTGGSTYGIPADVLNTTHTVYSSGVDLNSFIIDLDVEDDDSNSTIEGDNTNFVKGQYGGSGITMTRNLLMNALYFKTSDVVLPETSLRYAIKAEDSSGNFPTDWSNLQQNSNYFFADEKVIKSFENQTVISSTLRQSSLILQGTLNSTNVNVSPVIDLQKLSSYAITNLIDNQNFSAVNVDAIDERVMIDYDTVNNASVQATGSGFIATSDTGDATVTGDTTDFENEVGVGDTLYRTSDNAVIGTVDSITSATELELTTNASITISTNTAYYIRSAATLSFSNSGGYGVIQTNIDDADNLLANMDIGKHMAIRNAHANVDGENYIIQNVLVEDDTATFAGNDDADKVRVLVTPEFSGSASIDMISDSDFEIVMYDKFVEDFAPKGCHNSANYVTRTLTLKEAADSIKILFDASIVNGTSVDVYYRTWDGEVDLNTLPYVDSGYDSSIESFDTVGSFVEREINIDDIEPFLNVSIKIVMKSSNTSNVPAIKNLRLITHS